MTVQMATWLRAQPSLTGCPPPLDLTTLPPTPSHLFVDWLHEAVEAGVPEPLAATFATVDSDGVPDARTLILKDVSARGWAFAGERSSRKGTQLTANPVAALNFWWQPVMRAVRVRGVVREGTRSESEADLASRVPAARDAIHGGDWALWWVVPTRVEFWQGSASRQHTRIVYQCDVFQWSRDIFTGPGNERARTP